DGSSAKKEYRKVRRKADKIRPSVRHNIKPWESPRCHIQSPSHQSHFRKALVPAVPADFQTAYTTVPKQSAAYGGSDTSTAGQANIFFFFLNGVHASSDTSPAVPIWLSAIS